MRDNVERFFAWISERHAIYLRKSAGLPKPWTQNIIFQQYKFTNVFRKLDRVSQWLLNNWYLPNFSDPHLWFACCIARQINWPPTLEAIGYPYDGWNPDWATKVMDKLSRAGEKVYTGAYMIRAEPAEAGRSKNHYMCYKVLGGVWKDQELLAPFFSSCLSIEAATVRLKGYYGWGGFMAYESVSDMVWTPILEDAIDRLTWANPGPGAKRGLNRIFDRPLKAPVKEIELIKEMRTLLERSRRYPQPDTPPLEMRDIEHSLCEFDKYERVRLGEGRPRSLYDGGVK